MGRKGIVELVSLKLDFITGDSDNVPHPCIRWSNSFGIELLNSGGPRKFSALQNNIGGQGICFMPVDHIYNDSFGGVVQYGRNIKVRNIIEYFGVVFFKIDMCIQ